MDLGRISRGNWCPRLKLNVMKALLEATQNAYENEMERDDDEEQENNAEQVEQHGLLSR